MIGLIAEFWVVKPSRINSGQLFPVRPLQSKSRFSRIALLAHSTDISNLGRDMVAAAAAAAATDGRSSRHL